MAKFCVKCGNKLDDSGICSCEGTSYQEQAVPEERTDYTSQAVPQERYSQSTAVEHQYANTYHTDVDYSEKANQAKEVLSIGFNRGMNILMSLLKYPFSKGISFSNSEDLKSASIIISLHALLAAVFTALSFSRLNEIFSVFNELLNEFLGYSDVLNMKFPLMNIFVITLIGSALFSMIYASTLLLFSILFKNNVSYKAVLCAVASRSAVIIPVIALSIVLLFIMPYLGLTLFAMGNFAGIAYITQVFPVTRQENRNHVPLIVFLGTVLFLAVTYFIFINSYSMYLPAELKELIPYFEEMMSDPGSFY